MPKAAHTRLLESELMEIIDNTRIGIDPVNPSVPDWMWASFSPDWYIEDAVYTRSLDQSDRNVELLSFLREKKAVVVREIEPAYSNDKVQNRLRDPSIIYFGSEYQRGLPAVRQHGAYRRRDRPGGQCHPGARLGVHQQAPRRADRDDHRARPPEPNPYYDNRVEAMVDNSGARGAAGWRRRRRHWWTPAPTTTANSSPCSTTSTAAPTMPRSTAFPTAGSGLSCSDCPRGGARPT
ncbi:MAG: hypothetical protein M5U09_22550 [Gammaproteobacteria bacterium]|nr:hypothetical protein [Gammaproteobacteria bacterium]